MKLSVLGSGPGGYVAALKAAQLGAQVTVIEEAEVGGTCLNRGCIPTKALVASCEVLAKARKLNDYGIELKGEILPNFSAILERKDRIVNTQVKGIKNLFKSRGITVKEGRGTLTSPREILFTSKEGLNEKIESDTIIIATGSRPLEVPAFPFDGNKILSSDDILKLQEIPRSILIIGAGVIGCEFACIFKELGSEITMIEMLPRAVATEDSEISELLERELKKKKIKLHTGIKAEKADLKNDGVHVLLTNGKEIVAEKVLVSVGRVFNSNGIGAEETGVLKGICGEIIVNEKMRTNLPGVYAIGDVTGGLLLAHVASRQGIVAARNIMGENDIMEYTVVPAAIFTSPEIASVGIREQQAEAKGLKVRTGHFQFRASAKAHILGEIEGFIKIVADYSSDSVLGVHIIGPHASDLIHEAVLAIKHGLKAKDIAETIHAHPTLSETLMEAAEDVHGEAIHTLKR
jgi:dihydrolipoamide dehydrogenase